MRWCIACGKAGHTEDYHSGVDGVIHHVGTPTSQGTCVTCKQRGNGVTFYNAFYCGYKCFYVARLKRCRLTKDSARGCCDACGGWGVFNRDGKNYCSATCYIQRPRRVKGSMDESAYFLNLVEYLNVNGKTLPEHKMRLLRQIIMGKAIHVHKDYAYIEGKFYHVDDITYSMIEHIML